MRQREIIALEKRKAKAKAKREKEKLEKKEKEKKKKRAEIERRKKKNKEKSLKKKRIYEKKVRQKKKEEMIEKLKASGDRLGYFRIIITEGGERVKTLSRARTLLDAYEKYNSYISENKESGPEKQKDNQESVKITKSHLNGGFFIKKGQTKHLANQTKNNKL